jgi:ABC-type glycerol-3-phosphate transport system permease component
MSQGPFYAEYPDLPPPEQPSPGARDRVQLPATFLIVVGVINLLVALFALWRGMASQSIPPEEFERMMQQQRPEQYEELKRQGLNFETFFKTIINTFLIAGGVGVVAALLAIVGGIGMLNLRFYGVAVLASILALIPCISGLGCCLVGQGIGIWALVVLMSEEVRQAFQ